MKKLKRLLGIGVFLLGAAVMNSCMLPLAKETIDTETMAGIKKMVSGFTDTILSLPSVGLAVGTDLTNIPMKLLEEAGIKEKEEEVETGQ